MATQLQIRRGTSTQVAAFTGAEGEIVVNTTNDSVHVNDGSTAGGFELARADFNNISASATLTIGTLNTTNLDLTNLEVTNIKAKDGTAAGSIADSTGVVTLISSSLTTADITTLKIGGTTVTSTAAELNILDGVTSTAAELNILDGVTATTAELNHVDGVTSAIQTQIDAKAPIANPTFTGSVTTGGAVTIDLADGVADDAYALTVRNNEATDGRNYGLWVRAGSNSSDESFSVRNHDNSATYFKVRGDGNVGISTTDIKEKLSVNGAAVFDGNHATGTNAYRAAQGVMIHAASSTGFVTAVSNGANDVDLQLRALNGGAANSNQLVLDSEGGVGIGVTPAANFDVMASGANQWYIRNSDGSAQNNAIVSLRTGGYSNIALDGATVDLKIAGSSKLHVDSSGDLILAANATGAALIKGVSGDQTDRNAGGYPQYTFVGNEGTGIRRPSANVLAFDTGGAEAARFDSSQNFLVGKSATTQSTAGTVLYNNGQIYATANGAQVQVLTRTSTDGKIQIFYKDSAEVGFIGSDAATGISFTNMFSVNSGVGTFLHQVASGAGNSDLRYTTSTGFVTFDTSSRLVKEDIEEIPYGLEAIKKLSPKRYTRTDGEKEVELGLIADEVVAVIPEVVGIMSKSVFTKDESDTEQVAGSVRYSKLTAVLVKAIQEQQTLIESLTDRITALEQ